jgi:butyrate kinase
MDYYYDSDKEIQESELKIQYYKNMVETLQEIVDNLKWRHQTIKNMIEWKKFETGY